MKYWNRNDWRGFAFILAILLIAAMLDGCAANGDWTRRDTALEVSFQVINYLDARGTANIHSDPRFEEGSAFTRAVLGPQPDPNEAYVYFASMALSHYLISRALPAKWRPWYQGATIAHTGHAVIGLREDGLLR